MKTKGPENKPLFPNQREVPSWAHAIASIGTHTAKTILAYFEDQAGQSLFERADQDALKTLADALKAWDDGEAAKLIQICVDKLKTDEPVNLNALARWVMLHRNDSASVLDCMSVTPPEEIDIIQVLSRAGSQKLVFLATWRLTQRRVVLKQLTGKPDAVSRILARELQPHPLSMKHKNIIETHLLKNANNEAFLVERWIPQVLRDDWEAGGIQEAANLLFNISDAVAFLHSQDYVHGDIKPDNIGKEEDNYILLDFGICRRTSEFTRETSATGSLRTRAPELLLEDSYVDPPQVDVWALGATVYNSVVGRFPLIDRDEKIPRISHPADREVFERELARRVREEWSTWINLEKVPSPLRHLLELCLRPDPQERPTAQEVYESSGKQLSAFLRRGSTEHRHAPIRELDQFKAYFPSKTALALMPQNERERMRKKLSDLKETNGFAEYEKREIQRFLDQLVNA